MKTQKLICGLFLLTMAIFFAGCYGGWHSIDGNYDVMTETRDMPDFKKVFNEGEFDVYVIQDGSSYVEVEAESNLIPLIRTRIEGSALVVDTKDNLQNHFPMKVYVHTSEINEIKLSGSGLMHADSIATGDFQTSLSGSGNMFISGTANDVDCAISGSGDIEYGVVCDEINVKISGSGEMELFGEANKSEIHISGSGNIRAYEMLVQDCYVTISGSGDVYVNAEDYLNVDISGSGNVYYLGNPVIDTKITGSGNLIHP
jgi:hypothetical protein